MVRFSVVIPLYNKESAIKATLTSVLAQTFKNFEIIIVDDGSTDGSVTVIESIQDTRIQLHKKENEGVSATRNYGVAKASAPYIAFLDADDLWEPDHLLSLDALISAYPLASLYTSGYQKKFEYGTFPSRVVWDTKDEQWTGYIKDFFQVSLSDCIAWTSATVMSKEAFEALGGFDTSITHGAGEDTDLWIRAALFGKVAASKKVTATHVMDAKNRISHTPTLQRQFLNLDAYEQAARKNPALKKYLDLNRFSIAIQYKMAGDSKTALSYAGKLKSSNLNKRQRILLKTPSRWLRLLYLLKDQMAKMGIRFSVFS